MQPVAVSYSVGEVVVLNYNFKERERENRIMKRSKTTVSGDQPCGGGQIDFGSLLVISDTCQMASGLAPHHTVISPFNLWAR